MAEQIRPMVGRISTLNTTVLSPNENRIFSDDFGLIVRKMNEIDPELGRSFEREAGFYQHACQAAKAAFDNKPFGGLRPESGQFGMRLLKACDIGTIDWETNVGRSDVHSWVKSLTVAANSTWTDLFGSASDTVKPSTKQQYRSFHAVHALISWRPGTRAIATYWNVNQLPYTDFTFEMFSKTEKPDKTFKLLPVPGQLLLHPSGQYYCQVQLEKDDYASAETYTEEIGQLGIVFAEWNYLSTKLDNA